MQDCPLFDNVLWMKAHKVIHGGTCHKMANVMTVYSSAYNLMSEYGVTESLLRSFNESSKELRDFVSSEEYRNLDQLVEDAKRNLCWI
jgi:hypothetical protein